MSNTGIDKEKILHIANLARLNIEPAEIEKYTKQINEILGFVDTLKQADITSVCEKSHILASANFFRDDIARDSQSIEDTLKNAPDTENNFIKMPKIIE